MTADAVASFVEVPDCRGSVRMAGNEGMDVAVASKDTFTEGSATSFETAFNWEAMRHGTLTLSDLQPEHLPMDDFMGQGAATGLGMGLGLDMSVLEGLPSMDLSSCPSSSAPTSASDSTSGDFSFDFMQGLSTDWEATCGGQRTRFPEGLTSVDCEGFDLIDLVGPTLLAPEALEAELRAFKAGLSTAGMGGGGVGPYISSSDSASSSSSAPSISDFLLDDSSLAIDAPLGKRHSLYPVSKEAQARVRAEVAIAVRQIFLARYFSLFFALRGWLTST